jgi:hypothetical protein
VNPIFHEVPTLSLTDGLRAVRLKLYDQGSGRMVSFAQARAGSQRRHKPLATRRKAKGLLGARRLAESGQAGREVL